MSAGVVSGCPGPGRLLMLLLMLLLMACDIPMYLHEALGNILTSIVSNSHFWKRPGARDMIVFGSHVSPHIPNIDYLEAYEVYEGICGYMG